MARDSALASRCSKTSDHGGGQSYFSLPTILDFFSLSELDHFPSPLLTWSFADEEPSALSFLCLLTHIDPNRYLRAPRFDLSKPPESYHEACARPDADVWHAAMAHEFDSLSARNAFEPADLPVGRKAIGV